VRCNRIMKCIVDGHSILVWILGLYGGGMYSIVWLYELIGRGCVRHVLVAQKQE
jgi:hypothetical protein